jgi:hypothetical protein
VAIPPKKSLNSRLGVTNPRLYPVFHSDPQDITVFGFRVYICRRFFGFSARFIEKDGRRPRKPAPIEIATITVYRSWNNPASPKKLWKTAIDRVEITDILNYNDRHADINGLTRSDRSLQPGWGLLRILFVGTYVGCFFVS